ncbi:ABC transporter permease [Nocardia wallacei]|uniref:ABC transporter permease n=1 Tax=Nocardia wallacei TaxID=480035 RepID=UPI002453E545|nr:ABC transporter permease [Nocardia wallacei]
MTFLRDTGLIFWSQLRSNLRNPVWVLIGLSQPVLYLVLFGPLVKGIAPSLGPGTDPWEVLTPALVIQIGLFGAIYVGFGLVMELRAGVVERQRVTPASRAALLLGRAVKDMVVLIVQALLLVAVAALAFGLRPDPLGLLLSVPLMLLSGILLPLSVGPTWLQTIGKVNPFSRTVEAARALFRGDLGASEVYWGTGLTLAVALVLLVLGARSFARENA